MKVIIQLQYSLTDSRVFLDVKNITQSSLHPTQPNPPKVKKTLTQTNPTQPNLTQPNPWMDPIHDQLWKSGVRVSQVKPSNCFRLHPRSTTSKHSRIPVTATRRRIEKKIVLHSIFDTSFSSLMMWHALAELSSNRFVWNNVTF